MHRNCIDVTGQHYPLGPVEVCPRHDRVAVSVQRQVRELRQRAGDCVSQRSLVAAYRLDVDNLRGQLGCGLRKIKLPGDRLPGDRLQSVRVHGVILTPESPYVITDRLRPPTSCAWRQAARGQQRSAHAR